MPSSAILQKQVVRDEMRQAKGTKEHLLKEAVEKIPLHSETLSPSGNDQPPVVTPTVSEYVRSGAEKERRQIFHGDRRLRYERV